MLVVVYSVKEHVIQFASMAPGTSHHADAATPRSRGGRLSIRSCARRFPSVYSSRFSESL